MRLAHAEIFFAAMQSPEIHVYVPHEPPESAAELRTLFAHRIAGPERDDAVWRNWMIVRSGDDAPLGNVQITERSDRTALLGYWLRPGAWGQGYASEAIRAVLAEITAGTAVERVIAEIDTRNAASIALVERLGFARIAFVPRADFFKGSPSDEFHYSLVLRG